MSKIEDKASCLPLYGGLLGTAYSGVRLRLHLILLRQRGRWVHTMIPHAAIPIPVGRGIWKIPVFLLFGLWCKRGYTIIYYKQSPEEQRVCDPAPPECALDQGWIPALRPE